MNFIYGYLIVIILVMNIYVNTNAYTEYDTCTNYHNAYHCVYCYYYYFSCMYIYDMIFLYVL